MQLRSKFLMNKLWYSIGRSATFGVSAIWMDIIYSLFQSFFLLHGFWWFSSLLFTPEYSIILKSFPYFNAVVGSVRIRPSAPYRALTGCYHPDKINHGFLTRLLLLPFTLFQHGLIANRLGCTIITGYIHNICNKSGQKSIHRISWASLFCLGIPLPPDITVRGETCSFHLVIFYFPTVSLGFFPSNFSTVSISRSWIPNPSFCCICSLSDIPQLIPQH